MRGRGDGAGRRGDGVDRVEGTIASPRPRAAGRPGRDAIASGSQGTPTKERRRDTDLLLLLEGLEVRLNSSNAHGGLGLERELVGPQGIAPRQDLPPFESQIGAVEPLVLLGHLS